MTHRVVFLESAWQDFDEIYDRIADAAGPQTANDYLIRVENFCRNLRDFPDRGSPRADLKRGVRTVVFESRAVVAYVVDEAEVRIMRILHQGRDPGREFRR